MKTVRCLALVVAINLLVLGTCLPLAFARSEPAAAFIDSVIAAQVVELNFVWDRTSPLLGMNPPYAMSLAETHQETNGMIPELSFATDMMYFSGQHGAPTIDAIGHIGHNGRLYGDLDAATHESPGGLKKRGIEEYPAQRLVNRAVLLDVARYKKVSALDPGQEITAEDLEATAKAQNVEILPGNSVLIRTGYGQYFGNDKDKYMGYRPGPGESAARWLAEKGVFLTGADQLSYEVVPQQGTIFPVHRILLAENGIYIVENLNLEELSKVLAEHRNYEFLLVLNPPRIRGATGMPINAFGIIPAKKHEKANHDERRNVMRLLQMDFSYNGPGKEEMNRTLQNLAKSIAEYPGVIWKIWTVNEKTHEGGGIYLFEDEASLQSYVEMHTERLKGFGVTTVNAKVFEIPETLTKISRGQLTRNKNADITSSKATTEMRLLQMDFPFNGPGKEEMDQNLQELSQSIAEHPGIIWKIWTVNEKTHEGGGIYLFEDEASLRTYVEMHTERLKGFGVTTVHAKTFEVPEVLTKITWGPIPK